VGRAREGHAQRKALGKVLADEVIMVLFCILKRVTFVGGCERVTATGENKHHNEAKQDTRQDGT
jgi:hypothetical protein